MARRGGRPGDYLSTDDYLGVTRYASQLHRDYWGAIAEKPLLRNLQEIATPLEDPYPVNPVRSPSYEYIDPCSIESAPATVGNTAVLTSNQNMAMQSSLLNLNPAIPFMSIGCTFQVA